MIGLGGRTTAAAINDAGEVVGHSFVSRGNFHAFITGPNGVGMRSLGTLGGPVSQAFGINNSGQVVEILQTTGETRAFITGPGGTGMRDIGTVGGSYSYAYDINATGQVVGSSHTSSSEQHAIITNPNGLGMRDLGVFGSTNWAWGINDLGQAVGSSLVGPASISHAFITDPAWPGCDGSRHVGGQLKALLQLSIIRDRRSGGQTRPQVLVMLLTWAKS